MQLCKYVSGLSSLPPPLPRFFRPSCTVRAPRARVARPRQFLTLRRQVEYAVRTWIHLRISSSICLGRFVNTGVDVPM